MGWGVIGAVLMSLAFWSDQISFKMSLASIRELRVVIFARRVAFFCDSRFVDWFFWKVRRMDCYVEKEIGATNCQQMAA